MLTVLEEVQAMARADAEARGLEGVTAATSAVSSIAGGRLVYRGYDIDDVVTHSSYEETVYLLWNGELPTAQELERFRADLATERALPPELIAALRSLPLNVSPVTSLRTAVSVLAQYDPLADEMSQDANRRKGIGLVARFPTIVATVWRLRQGLEPPQPDPSMGQAGNFLFMLSGDRPTSSRARALDAVWVLHADHELNASTFAARVAASTLADLHSAVLAALCALKGRLHGGAAEGVMAMIEAAGEPANAAAYVREAVAARQRIMGFGHRIYRQGDPRAAWLRRMAEDLAGETGDRRRFDITRAIEREVAERTGLLPNIDLYSASVYAYLGIPPALFTSMFAVSRVAGWIAHILEQYDNNRLIRPLAEYVGPSPRPYIPLSER